MSKPSKTAAAKSSTFTSTKQFPEDFLLGTATAAFQVEGAWDEDKKQPTIWDDFFHSGQKNRTKNHFIDVPEPILKKCKEQGIEPKLVHSYKGMPVYEVPSSTDVDGIHYDFNGDVAADTYHKTDTDVQLLKELGVQVYRFTISIARIIPDIHGHLPNKAGIDYYNHLIDKLIENDIVPMVSLWHYDMQSSMKFLGGLANAWVHKFYIDYVRLCFQVFGDRVKYWTASSDIQLAAEGYSSEIFAPGIEREEAYSGFSDYITLHTCLLSHSHVYKMYNEEFKETQQGELGLCVNGDWFAPQDPDDPEHVRIAELARLSTFGLALHAAATGEYPAEVVEAIDRNSRKEGMTADRLRQFSGAERELIKGSYDFIIFNYYNTIKVRPLTEEELANEQNLKRRDRGYAMDFDNTSLKEVQDGFMNCLTYMDKLLNKPKIFIGENGFPEDEGVDDSVKKIAYHNAILSTLLEALDQKINVFGYCVWSFVDTLELTFGYRKKFGIYAVDFNDEKRPRTKKNSFPFFQKLFKTKSLPAVEN